MPMEKDDIARQITEETIAEHKEARMGREDQPWDAADTDRMQRLAALMVGPRKHVAIPIILEAFPQMAALLQRDFGHITQMPACEACKGSGESEEIAAMSAMGPHLYWPCKTCNGAPEPGVIQGPGGRTWCWLVKDVKSWDGVDRLGKIESGHLKPGNMVTFVSSDDGVALQIDVIEVVEPEFNPSQEIAEQFKRRDE